MAMIDDEVQKARVYTDIQGLNQLKFSKNSDAVKKEVAQQFEALLMQMVFKSMRDVAKTFSSGLFSSTQMDIYQDMFDHQISLMLSNSNLGFSKMVEQSISQMTQNQVPQHADIPTPPPIHPAPLLLHKIERDTQQNSKKQESLIIDQIPEEPHSFSSQEEFVKKLWATAKNAAYSIGAAPDILLAQAALETNWGKNILSHEGERSSHNLFNIKAGTSWKDKTTTIDTIEQKGGVLIKEKSAFRSYDSFKESFMDYIQFLKGNDRYKNALDNASDPKTFIHALHKAGYATDPDYAEKVWNIFSSQSFKNIVEKVKKSIKT